MNADMLTLAQLWSALSAGLLAVEALLATRGPRPIEPADDAEQAEVDAWAEADSRWQSAGDEMLERLYIRPGVIAHQRAGIEAEMREALSLLPEYGDGCDDWDAALRETIAETLGAGPEWVGRLWSAYR